LTVTYHRNVDLLYICLDDRAEQVSDEDMGEDVHLELGEGDRIVAIEILDASKRVDAASLVSLKFAEAACTSAGLRFCSYLRSGSANTYKALPVAG
jgi:uncharacterized protein YuzE